MVLIVHKYGGTSIGSVERIRNVAKRVAKWYRAGYQIVVVPSAMPGETSRLLDTAKEISTQPDPRELDMTALTGEQVSVGLLAIALHVEGIDACSHTGWQVPVKTDSVYIKARIQPIDDERVRTDLGAGRAVVIMGFRGIGSEGHITTLGRGGSDTSAVTVAAALEAEECLIYIDVDGVYTTNPCAADDACRLDKIIFEEMLEMASLGSKMLQIRSVEFTDKYRVKTRVLSSLTDPLMPFDVEMNLGTLIISEEDLGMEATAISGVAPARDEAKITVIGVPDKPGVAYQILGPVADASVDVDTIIQNQLVEGKTDSIFTVPHGEYQRVLTILNDSVKAYIGATSVSGDPRVLKTSVVGVGMRSYIDIASKMFRTLSEEGINTQVISILEIKISVLIDEKYMELAVCVLHKAFELDQA